jgi:hypothetical protein
MIQDTFGVIFQAVATNFSLQCKSVIVKNTLAYYAQALITTV